MENDKVVIWLVIALRNLKAYSTKDANLHMGLPLTELKQDLGEGFPSP